jgi:hypothetical protein
MITTIYGDMDESALVKRTGVIDNAHEQTTWIEYYLGDELVHRSVHVQLKEWPEGLGAILADMT